MSARLSESIVPGGERWRALPAGRRGRARAKHHRQTGGAPSSVTVTLLPASDPLQPRRQRSLIVTKAMADLVAEVSKWWQSGKIEQRALLVVLGSVEVSILGFAISSWAAAGKDAYMPSAQFVLAWTSILMIAAGVLAAAFVVVESLRNEFTFGTLITSFFLIGQFALLSALSSSSTKITSYTSMAVFASLVAILTHAFVAIAWYMRAELVPTYSDSSMTKGVPNAVA